ncbi:MAG: hypothetical protein IPH30_07945 [Betaproteobacteria bacterium]|jgi:hypothetical protein|nr:hypothetical protein [Betaproteobacteria bacterium]
MLTRIALAAVATALALPAFAQAETPRVDKRQANQERRIEKGVQSGNLNAREAARLEKGQERVGKLEEKAKADGTVTKKERAVLHRAQEKQSKRIAKQKHDKQKAAPAPAAGSGG